jgi:hypothetical protein
MGMVIIKQTCFCKYTGRPNDQWWLCHKTSIYAEVEIIKTK